VFVAAALASGAVTNASAAGTSVPVVRCKTVFGIQNRVVWPSSVRVLHAPASVKGLVAYSNSQLVLIGPAGMDCSGIVATDGGSQVVAWPYGHARPGQHSRGDGLTLTIDPACASCKADDACPFFTALATSEGFPCSAGIPAGEQVHRVGSDLAEFEDPPGVAGSGWPSGGADPANGVVGLAGPANNRLVYRSTCTLPAAEHAVCTVGLNDVLSRYG
jgi:hypothetical protein